NTAVGVYSGGVTGFDHDRGKRRFEERRAGNLSARRELVRGIHWHFAPRTEIDAALPLQGQRPAAIRTLLRQGYPGQPSEHRDAQGYQTDLLRLLVIGIEFLIARVEIARPLLE